MKLTDERIIKYLKEKFGNDFDLTAYVNPSEKNFRDAHKLKDITKVADKIKKFVQDDKKILIYGDYDTDGICASTILYLFLKSIGANVDVYIPNRFENGYGISVEAIEVIIEEYSPDLIVTVDLGITAVEEVEILKQEGVEIVITDHHLPLDEVPDCLIVDPKYNNEDYGFDGLCGTGVAYKLVEVMSDRQTANKYLDIAAIATVGDIVPLIDENRAIAKLGIEKINNSDCLESLKFIKEKLGIEKLTSTDISFKIVPRFNSSGRMDNALKVFDFLIQTDKKLLEEKYAEIEADNTLRLATIDRANKTIDSLMRDFDFNKPSILIAGDFHEGTVGIIASRLAHDYNKPTIVFAKTENGTLKGSGRSIDSVNLHEIIASMADNLINFGGHKMAVGLEIETDYFDKFEEELNRKILEITNKHDFLIQPKKSDIEISEDDLNIEFAKQLELLEPFGDSNERPNISIIQNKMIVQPINEKVFKHYKCFTERNNQLVAFNFYKDSFICQTQSKKRLFVEPSISLYKGKPQYNCYLKEVDTIDYQFDKNKTQDFVSALYNKYYSTFDFNDESRYHVVQDIEAIIKKKFNEDDYGTIVVASTEEDLKIIKKLRLEKFASNKPYKNCQNVIVANPRQVYDLSDVFGYKNIIFMHRYFDDEHLFYSQRLNVYENAKKEQIFEKISGDRLIFAKIYKMIENFSALKSNDILDFCEKLSIKDKTINYSQILFCSLVFMELNFIEFDEVLNSVKILKAKKNEITNSKFYQQIMEN